VVYDIITLIMQKLLLLAYETEFTDPANKNRDSDRDRMQLVTLSVLMTYLFITMFETVLSEFTLYKQVK